MYICTLQFSFLPSTYPIITVIADIDPLAGPSCKSAAWEGKARNAFAAAAMKEVIYIQAGEFSNYAGAHFWNTQESYLSGGEPGDTDIEPDVSFCESVDGQVRSCCVWQ